MKKYKIRPGSFLDYARDVAVLVLYGVMLYGIIYLALYNFDKKIKEIDRQNKFIVETKGGIK